jgi:hypothetical protein
LEPELLEEETVQVLLRQNRRVSGPIEGGAEGETFGTFFRLYGYGGKPR